MDELSKLPNIGEKVEEQLNAVGIFTYEDLKKLLPEERKAELKSFYEDHKLYK